LRRCSGITSSRLCPSASSPHRNFIGGEWVAAGDAAENVDPSDLRDVVELYAQASRQQVQDAIATAHAAQPRWAGLTPQQRTDALDRVGGEIAARHDELADLLAR
jgi:alpha-ketoglutaric semialdehyde dehydrogenase